MLLGLHYKKGNLRAQSNNRLVFGIKSPVKVIAAIKYATFANNESTNRAKMQLLGS